MKSLTRDISLRTKPGEPLPPFVVRSVTGKKIDSETCHGRPILVLFQLFFKAPFFNEKQFHQFESMVDSLKTKGDLEVIVITESTSDDIKSVIDVKNSNFQIIPEGRNFSVRYLVIKFPSYLLIDKEGKLVYYYEENEITKLQQDIVSKLF
jgi:cytochrome oxidase Cu insertion factor (SCO1/SenC/PrrC family)